MNTKSMFKACGNAEEGQTRQGNGSISLEYVILSFCSTAQQGTIMTKPTKPEVEAKLNHVTGNDAFHSGFDLQAVVYS